MLLTYAVNYDLINPSLHDYRKNAFKNEFMSFIIARNSFSAMRADGITINYDFCDAESFNSIL